MEMDRRDKRLEERIRALQVQQPDQNKPVKIKATSMPRKETKPIEDEMPLRLSYETKSSDIDEYADLAFLPMSRQSQQNQFGSANT